MEEGTVKRIPAGSKLLLQMHYSKTTGKVEKDRSSIGLVFAKKPADKHVYTHGIANVYFQIPPGAGQSQGDFVLDDQRRHSPVDVDAAHAPPWKGDEV